MIENKGGLTGEEDGVGVETGPEITGRIDESLGSL
jgi:hypothetical protein